MVKTAANNIHDASDMHLHKDPPRPTISGYALIIVEHLTHVLAGHLQLEEGTQMVMPGDNFRTGIELTLPVALSVGVRFAIRDSGRTVGAGVVTELGK